MSKPVRILGIAGSLRRESYNRAALRAAAQLVPADATLDIFELDGIPGFSQDEEQNPPAKVVELKRRIREADAVLFVTPEYNYSVPGVLKNAIDWASRPYGDSAWSGKPAAIMGAPLGPSAPRGAIPSTPDHGLPEHVSHQPAGGDDRPRRQRFDKEGNLTDETTKDLIRQLLTNLAAWTRGSAITIKAHKGKYQCGLESLTE